MGIGIPSHAKPDVKKTNWTKRAAFTLLVVLGLVFWIPPLLRATVGDTDEAAVLPEGAARETAPTSDADHLVDKLNGWTGGNVTHARSSRPGTGSLVLTATILGKTRRAAVVNGRVTRESDRIVVADELFRLVRVLEDRIELVREGKNSEGNRSLTIRVTPQHDGKK